MYLSSDDPNFTSMHLLWISLVKNIFTSLHHIKYQNYSNSVYKYPYLVEKIGCTCVPLKAVLPRSLLGCSKVVKTMFAWLQTTIAVSGTKACMMLWNAKKLQSTMFKAKYTICLDFQMHIWCGIYDSFNDCSVVEYGRWLLDAKLPEHCC